MLVPVSIAPMEAGYVELRERCALVSDIYLIFKVYT
jgi:hypothetical protein